MITNHSVSDQARDVLVTGGGGYVGTVLTQELLRREHRVTVIDNFWFGNALPKSPNLTVITSDIRELDHNVFDNKGFDSVIHLANIANDPAVELNQITSWEVNVLAGKTLIESAILSGVKRFIFASSGSVYGVSDSPVVTEEHPLVPISAYNKTKMIAERLFESYGSEIEVFHIRPATVCGVSPRMRLDVSVNMLTYQALNNRHITVFGGRQVRPNIHIDDLVRLYYLLVETNMFQPGVYNAGFENLTIMEIAEKIQKQIDCKISIEPTVDIRSYRQDSSKLLQAGFKPKKSVEAAISELRAEYERGNLVNDARFHTVKWMTMNNLI